MSSTFSKFPLRVAAALLVLALPLAAAKAAEPPRVMLETSLGEFVIQLDMERAPLTSANFLQYVKEGFYNGTIIHRIENNFVVQGGGYDTAYKSKTTRGQVVNESGNGLSNKRFTVGLARTGSPHSGTSQFYVNLADNEVLDPNPARWGYAVFGKIVDGFQVVDQIGQQPTGDVATFKASAPLTQIVIRRAFLLSPAAASVPAAVTPAAAPAKPEPIPAPTPAPAPADGSAPKL
jgi:cyclophilin family peptidyl-prolyl cis-trans isomerase